MTFRAIVGLSFALLLFAAQGSAEEKLTAWRIFDGDSFMLSDGREIRLIGVDCPEHDDAERNGRNAARLGLEPRRYAGYSAKAKQFLEELTAGRTLRTEADPGNQVIGHHDKYGRFLAYVYAGEVMINEALIHRGYCVTYRRFNFRHKKTFLKLEEDAKQNKRGMWG